MKIAGPWLLAAALLLPAGVRAQDSAAATADKPYSGIVLRNMFGLLPIPPPDTNPPAPPVEPPPKITPKGIMTIFGRNQAIFNVALKPKPGQPAKDDSCVLSEGERQDDIEVVKINKEDGIITFNNHGTMQDLALVEANPTTPAGAPPGAMPSGPQRGVPMPGGMQQRPNPMFPVNRAAASERFAGRQGNPGMNPGGNPGGYAGGSSGINLNGGTSANTSYQPPVDTSMTPEQKVLLMEAQRAKYLQENNPMANLIPPTGLTKQLNPDFGGNGNSGGSMPSPP
jgi:hypothetical protein